MKKDHFWLSLEWHRALHDTIQALARWLRFIACASGPLDNVLLLRAPSTTVWENSQESEIIFNSSR